MAAQPGYYQPPGATAPIIDPAGTYTDMVGATAPIQAPPGTYVGTTGATAATVDPVGTFTSSSGSVAATPAPPGTYVGTTGATAATVDPVGTYTGVAGSTAPILAPPGTYVSTLGATAPTPAPPGYYDPGTGNTAPIPLPVTFTPGTSGQSIGYWSNHQSNSAWNQTGEQGNVLLGHGAAPIGGPLLLPAAAAIELISASQSAKDARQILTAQAEATQLNINAGANDPGGQTAGHDLISEAVYWLEGRSLSDGSPSFIYADHSSGNVDANHNGKVDTATSGAAPAIDYNSRTGAFTFAGADGFQVANNALAANANAWKTMVDTGVLNSLTGSNFMVDGEGLKSALQAFNQGQLVTSGNGQLVGWFNGATVTDPHMNNAAGMWTVLKDAGITGIS